MPIYRNPREAARILTPLLEEQGAGGPPAKLSKMATTMLIAFPKSEDQADIWGSLAKEAAEEQGRIDPK